MASQARLLNLIGHIDNSKDTWRIKVRVARLYEVPSWNNPKEICRIEMILLDEKNDKIQASVKDKLIRVYRPLIHEGELYTISNFLVLENNDKLKTCKNKWKINFHRNTSVKDCPPIGIDKFGFEMVSFQNIFDQLPLPNVFIDIIGCLKGKSPVEIVRDEDGKTTKKMTIKLRDENSLILEVLLWGDYVDLLLNYVDSHPEKRVVVIVQFAKLKYFNRIPYVSNSFYATKLLLNKNCEATTSFLERYGDTDDDAYLLEEIAVGRSLSIQEEFLSLTKRVQIADIVAIKEPCFCVVVGTIKRVETQHDWFYSSCKLCATEVTMNDNGTFYCFKCKKTVKFVSTRYKVVFKVEDDSGSASLLMFCREMIQLIQKTAVDLRETLIKNGEDGLFPIEFDDLLEKQFLFKLNISEYNLSKNYKVYTVSRITDDPELLSAHFALLQTQELYNVSDAATATAGTSQTISFINENESVSVIGDNREMNSSDACNITPSKRGIEEVVPGELYILGEEGQSSAIRPRIVVKVEKDV
ncbi:replication protein A 70 kDa DNA-binding subunit A-like [Silene latifolia]|uniref:replication protein A 70 kDa DNA-binding subunit A-like n=1 Tax=Silene latifolia TaxID=37657 RepID=UPI003D774D58